LQLSSGLFRLTGVGRLHPVLQLAPRYLATAQSEGESDCHGDSAKKQAEGQIDDLVGNAYLA
jgi:hypothetical protein